MTFSDAGFLGIVRVNFYAFLGISFKSNLRKNNFDLAMALN